MTPSIWGLLPTSGLRRGIYGRDKLIDSSVMDRCIGERILKEPATNIFSCKIKRLQSVSFRNPANSARLRGSAQGHRAALLALMPGGAASE